MDAMVRACAEAHRLLASSNQTPALLAEVRRNGWTSELDMQPDKPWPELSADQWKKHVAGLPSAAAFNPLSDPDTR